MQTSKPQPIKSTWPAGTPSRYGPLAGMIYEQTRLEFRAHDDHPDAVHLLLSPTNRATRLQLARAIGHAAHTLREDEGLSNDVVNLVHEANRLIARRPIPPRRRKMDLTRVESFLTQAGIGGDLPLSAFPADELPDPDLRLRLDFIGHNGDQAYPNVLCFRYDLFQNRDNLESTTEAESTTPPKTETNATATPGSADRQVRNSAASSKGPGFAGIGLPALRVNVPAHLATLVTVLLMFAFVPSPPFENGTRASINSAARASRRIVAATADCAGNRLYWNGETQPLSEKFNMPQRLIMIVLDGLRPEFVTAERTPHLYRLQTGGVHFQNHRTIFPSVTRVCSSSIATGAHPGVHGVVDNSFYVRDLTPGKINTGDHNDLWRLDKHAQATSANNGGLFALPAFTELLAAAGKKTGVATTASPGTSLLQDPRRAGMLVNQGLILPEQARGAIEAQYGKAPEITVPVTATNRWATRILIEEMLIARQFDYMVSWITDPDKTQHRHGLGHPTSLQAIAEVDDCVGRVVAAMDSDASLRRDVNLVVLSDHGWINYERDWPLREQLAASKLAPAAGEDLAAERIRIHGQGIYLLPGCRSTRSEILAALREQPECGMLLTHDGLAGTLPYSLVKYDNPRAPEIVFTPVWDDRANAFGVKGMSYGGGPGSHGGASPYELTTFCAAIGPAFKKETPIGGPTGHVDLLPTFARILGLSPPPAPRCGRVLTEALVGGAAEGLAPPPSVRTDIHDAVVETGRGRCLTRLERAWVGATFYIQSGNAFMEQG